jgi:hypothetical protein
VQEKDLQGNVSTKSGRSETMVGGTRVLLYCSPLTPEQRDLWQVSIDDRSPRKIGAFEGMSRLSVHPDGRQIAFSALKRQTEIWVMENFLPED